MPAHPKEENTSGAVGSITDQVAKESKDSTASSHPLHDEDHDVSSGGSAKATLQDHKATPGPVISESLGDQEVSSKEDLKKRAAELNK